MPERGDSCDSMHHFNRKTGFSFFEFAASPREQVWLVGDFTDWTRRPLPMQFEDGRWTIRIRLPAGRYHCAFLLRDGLYGAGTIEVPLWFEAPSEEWFKEALQHRTCGKHFWKWN